MPVISNPRSAKQRRSTLASLRPSVFTFLDLGIAGGNIVIHLFSLKVQLPRVQIFYQITHVSSDFLQCGGIDSWLIFQGHVGFRQGTSKGAGEKKEGLQGFTISNESTLIPQYEARLRDSTWKQVNPLCVSPGYLKQPCHLFSCFMFKGFQACKLNRSEILNHKQIKKRNATLNKCQHIFHPISLTWINEERLQGGWFGDGDSEGRNGFFPLTNTWGKKMSGKINPL